MKKIIFDDPFLKKNLVESEYLYDINNHKQFLYKIINNIDFSYNKIIINSIKQKYSSYKSQDKLKHKYDENQFLTFNELLFKLLKSNLNCYYCNDKLKLIYKNKNENKQWSLERFDNNIGHYNNNTCITCLKCNLQRRTDNHEYFKMGKQLTIVKK